jgi:structural maintenance of chromosome 3 (chondroitin sulfate proteoglycan 6)
MLKEKTGRVTFMPLNRLNPRNPQTPNEDDAEPLIDKLQYDSKFEKAFQQVFGKTCVCKDLTTAASYVRSHGINTITLDGDKVDRKGALTGGYHDVRRSRIEGIKNVTTWRVKHDADRKKSDEVKQSISRLEQEITTLAGKITVLNGQQGQIRESRDRMADDGTTISREKERVKARIVKLEMDIDELEMEQHSLQTKIAGYQQELASPLSNGLTTQEEGLITALGKEVERRKKEILELSKRRNQVCCSHLSIFVVS